MKSIGLIFVAFFILASCGGSEVPEEPTEVTQEMQGKMNKIRETLTNILSVLPEVGTEEELIPENKISGIGSIEGDDLVRLFVLEEPHLKSLANGAEDVQEIKDEGGAWFSSGNWAALDAEPLAEHKMYTPLHDKLIKHFSGMNYLGVVRLNYYHSGKISGDEIVKSGDLGIWFWLIDVNSKEIVGAKFIETVNDDMIYSSSSGSSILASNLRYNAVEMINENLISWGAKKETRPMRVNDWDL